MVQKWRSPVEVGSFSRYLEGFSPIPGGDRWISEASTAVLSNLNPCFGQV